jgi:hypothetical protein
VCVREREREKEFVCVSVCVCTRVCLCVCVWQTEHCIEKTFTVVIFSLSLYLACPYC